MSTERAPGSRRRGDDLVGALLTAAWDELVAVGYGRMTMRSVAERAGTSEPVLYRRWANKDELTLAALEEHRRRNPVAAPDTGSLRGDLLAELMSLGTALAGFYAIVVAASGSGLLADTGSSPRAIRERVLAAQHPPGVREVYRRAAERGELDLERTPAAVLAMPFDLVRHDLLLDLDPPPPERIRTIVDDLFLPLVERRP